MTWICFPEGDLLIQIFESPWDEPSKLTTHSSALGESCLDVFPIIKESQNLAKSKAWLFGSFLGGVNPC